MDQTGSGLRGIKQGQIREAMETLTTTDKYLDLFEQKRKEISNGDPQFVSKLREESIASFQKSGFPFRKEERYKYTHLEPVFDGELNFDFHPRDIRFDDSELFRCDVPMLDAHVLTVLNGFFHHPEGPALSELDNGIIYGSLKEAIHTHPCLLYTSPSPRD